MKRIPLITAILTVSVAIAVVACRSAAPTLDAQSRDEIEQLEKLVDKSVDPTRAEAGRAALQGVKQAERELFRTVRDIDRALFATNREYASTADDLRRVLAQHRGEIARSRSVLLARVEQLENSVSREEWTRIRGGLASIEYR